MATNLDDEPQAADAPGDVADRFGGVGRKRAGVMIERQHATEAVIASRSKRLDVVILAARAGLLRRAILAARQHACDEGQFGRVVRVWVDRVVKRGADAD